MSINWAWMKLEALTSVSGGHPGTDSNVVSAFKTTMGVVGSFDGTREHLIRKGFRSSKWCAWRRSQGIIECIAERHAPFGGSANGGDGFAKDG